MAWTQRYPWTTAVVATCALALIGCGGGGSSKKPIAAATPAASTPSTSTPSTSTPSTSTPGTLGGTTPGGTTTTPGGTTTTPGGTTTTPGGTTTTPGGTTTTPGGTTTTPGGTTTTPGGTTTTPGGQGGTTPAGVFLVEGFDASPYGNFGTIDFNASTSTNAVSSQAWGVGTVNGQSVAGVTGSPGYGPNLFDALVSPTIDLSQATNPVLAFTHSYDIEDGWDGAKILVWDGVQLQEPDIVGGYPAQNLQYSTGLTGWFTGTQSSFQQVVVDLTAFAGLNDVALVFLFNSDVDDTSKPAGWGGYWLINDVAVGEATALGVSVSGGTTTTPGGTTTTPGGTTTTPGGTTTTPGGTTTTPGGTTTTPSNAQVLFTENFEGSNYNIGTTGNGAATFYVADPSQYNSTGGPTSAPQGQSVAGTVFSTAYGDNADEWLYTAEVDLTGRTSATLSFKAFYSMETYTSTSSGTVSGVDGVRILASPDQGQSWYLLTPDQGYDFQNIDAFTAGGSPTPGFSGKSNGWKEFTVDLSPAISAGSKWIVAWQFASDYSIGDAGFFIDAISVTGQ